MVPDFDQPSPLLLKVKQLLKDDPRTLFKISKESGMPYAWMYSFTHNSGVSISVNRAQYLYEYLTQTKLEV